MRQQPLQYPHRRQPFWGGISEDTVGEIFLNMQLMEKLLDF
jgi:hypothetical protein